MSDETLRSLADTRARLVMGDLGDGRHIDPPMVAFFGTLAFRLRFEVNQRLETAAVDGRRMVVNPQWWEQLSKANKLAVFVHEILHCANQHMVRCEGREPAFWNMACDLAINNIIAAAGFSLPDGALFPREFGLPEGLAAEEYYNLLSLPPSAQPNPLQRAMKQLGQKIADQEDPGGCGGVVHIDKQLSRDTVEELRLEWATSLALAKELAQQRGTLPESLTISASEILQPKIYWQEVLREYMSLRCKDDYTWSFPNRRFISSGIYMPSLSSQGKLSELVIFWDGSASMRDFPTKSIAGEIQEIATSAGSDVTILYHNALVSHIERWHPGEGELRIGGPGRFLGGTDHRPVFDWVANKHINPSVAIAFTDLETRFPERPPPYPVIWVSNARRNVPFGQVVVIN